MAPHRRNLRFRRYSQVGVWASVVLGTFLVPPVLDRYSGGVATAPTIRLAVAILSALLVVAFAMLPPKPVKRLLAILAAALALGLGSGWLYVRDLPVRTATFEQTRIVIGDLKSDAETRQAIDRCCSVPGPTPVTGCRTGEGLLWCASGNPARFYTDKSLARNWWFLSILYLTTAGFLTCALAAGARMLGAGTGQLAPLRVFISYSRRDEHHRAALAGHVRNFERIGFVESWYDGEIQPGDDWEKRIETNLKSADVILLLVSQDFLESPYCMLECKRALERAIGQVTVVPILVGECKWQDMPFARLQVIPRQGGPLSTWADSNAAWAHVMDELVKVLEQRTDLTRP